MYSPPEYSWTDRTEIAAFIRKHPFMILTTTDSNGHMQATHLPLVLKTAGDNDEWILTGHMAAANLQWKNFEPHNQAMIICPGPHAYVSPAHYGSLTRVPTWNYLAVHLYGTATIVENADERAAILSELIAQSEEAYAAQWAHLPDDYKQRLYAGIVPFAIRVERIEATQKLSQDKSEEDRERIIRAYERGTEDEQRLAAFMRGATKDKAS